MKTSSVSDKLPTISIEALAAIKKGVEEKHSISNLENLGVKQRLINLLESHKISNLEQLMFHKKETLLSIPNFGKRQLFVLFEALSKYNELENEYK
jgi:DNA-directed RNA polymerase alpha subunit